MFFLRGKKKEEKDNIEELNKAYLNLHQTIEAGNHELIAKTAENFQNKLTKDSDVFEVLVTALIKSKQYKKANKVLSDSKF